MSILSLANETLYQITEGFGPKDLNSLIQSSRRLARVLTPQFNLFALKPRYRVTALYWAAINGNEDLVRLVLAEGKNFMVKEFSKSCGDPGDIIYYASSRRLNEGLVQHILELGSTGAIIVQDNLDGTTPLHWAIRHGHDVMFKMLLEKAYYLETQDHRGWTALHQAVNEENEMAVEMLLDQGAGINAPDRRHSRPIHHAAMNGSEVMARMLLEWHGLELDCMDTEKHIPFETAVECGHRHVAKLLLEMAGSTSRGHRKPAVSRVERNAVINHIPMLLLAVTDVVFKNIWTESDLHLAIRYGYPDCAKSFILNGANVTATNRTGDTPLHLAAKYADTEIVGLLLDKGADINGRDAQGWTPLHLAVHYNLKYIGVVELLLKRGADITRKTNDKDTAIDLARNDFDSDRVPEGLFGSTEKKAKIPVESEDSGGPTEQPDPETSGWLMANHRRMKVWQVMYNRPDPAWQLSNCISIPPWIMVDHSPQQYAMQRRRNVAQKIAHHSDEWHKRQSEAEERGKELVKLLLEYGAETETETESKPRTSGLFGLANGGRW